MRLTEEVWKRRWQLSSSYVLTCDDILDGCQDLGLLGVENTSYCDSHTIFRLCLALRKQERLKRARKKLCE